jgi:glycine/D-amino acid oxidase-like deaminating enzyme
MTPKIPSPGAARSFWLQEALAHDPGDPCPPLNSHVKADVCIVGGGFAGLWTAVELTQREPGLRVVLLEQDIVGGGASGRNGGFMSSSWWDLSGLTGLYGDEEGLRYATVLADAVGEAGSWIEASGIDCWFHHEGVVGALTGEWQKSIGHGSDPFWHCERLGVPDRMVRLSAEETRAYADSPRFVGGSFIRDSAICQPARLARGMRRVLLERNVRIFEGTKAAGVEDVRGAAVIRTGEGAVKADQAVLTAGSWAAEWPAFRRSFVVVADYVVATEPIPEKLERIGWTSGVGIGDGREWLYYLRPTDDGRIVIGGGTGRVAFGNRAGARSMTHVERVAKVAAEGLLWMFPQLEGTRLTHAWGGPMDMSATLVPFYRSLAPGNVHAGLGFSGHGLTQTMVGGRILASKVLGVKDRWTQLAVNRPELAKVPPEPFRWPALELSARALRMGDVREEAGRPRGRLLEMIGSAPLAYRERLMGRPRGRPQ